MITGIAPKIGQMESRIEIRTQFSGTVTKNLKKTRVISSNFTVNQT
jgi:hypothetical protein